MNFQEWQDKKITKEKKKQTNQELLEVLSEINNKEEIDYSETLQEIKKIIDEKSIDLSEVISTIKGIKLEQKEVDLSSVVKAIENIPKPEKVVIPEQKEDKKTHSLLEKISKWEFPKSFWLNKDQFKSLINNLKEITDAVEKVKTSVSVSGGGSGGVGKATEAKQDDIITAINDMDVNIEKLDVNTDELEAKLDTLNTDKALESKQLPDNHQVTVSNQLEHFSTDTKQDEILTSLGELKTSNNKLKQDFSVRNKEETVDYKFVGFEILGSGDWKIMRIDLNSTEMETLYAIGTSDYATNWADRLTLTYN